MKTKKITTVKKTVKAKPVDGAVVDFLTIENLKELDDKQFASLQVRLSKVADIRSQEMQKAEFEKLHEKGIIENLQNEYKLLKKEIAKIDKIKIKINIPVEVTATLNITDLDDTLRFYDTSILNDISYHGCLCNKEATQLGLDREQREALGFMMDDLLNYNYGNGDWEVMSLFAKDQRQLIADINHRIEKFSQTLNNNNLEIDDGKIVFTDEVRNYNDAYPL